MHAARPACSARRPNNANGLARDRQGRLLTCEHLTRRVTRTEYDGSITVLADRFDGKRLNSPNDIVCARDGSIWFTDPLFGIAGHWEGEPADSRNCRRRCTASTPASGALQQVIDDLAAPNGLAFSPDERGAVRGREPRRAAPQDLGLRRMRPTAALSNKRLYVDAQGPGASTASRSTRRATSGAASAATARGADGAALDGVRVFDPTGKAIGHIHLPERCANLCFGGAKNNRLFMAASHSLYALFVNVQGAV